MRIGCDIIEIPRIERLCGNERFLRRVFDEEELAAVQPPLYPPSLAARFAAKEAVMKLLGCRLPFREIAVMKQESGQPYVILKGSAADCAKLCGCGAIAVSLSHCREYATAVAVAE